VSAAYREFSIALPGKENPRYAPVCYAPEVDVSAAYREFSIIYIFIDSRSLGFLQFFYWLYTIRKKQILATIIEAALTAVC
jgi:hypothetical protein